MRHLYTILAATLVLFASCSSSRKTAQTPDDVYYSPGSGKAAVNPDADEYTAPASQGDYYSTAPSDNYVRLKTQDQSRWSYFDDYDSYDSYYAGAAYSPYYSSGFAYPYYGYGSGWSIGFWNPYLCWNSYFLWNSWYNPYFYNPYYGGGVLAKVPANSVYSNLRTFNSNVYRQGMFTRVSNSNNRTYRPASSTYYTPGTRTGNGRYLSGNGNGNSYRPGSNNSNTYRSPNSNNTYTPANNSSRPSYSAPVRTYSPAPSGGGGGGFSRPGRH